MTNVSASLLFMFVGIAANNQNEERRQNFIIILIQNIFSSPLKYTSPLIRLPY